MLTNFYGGGNLGGVVGNVTSILDGTTHVYGSVFGAGYSATVPNVTIHNKDKVAPSIDVNTGIITPQSGGSGTTYTWTDKTSLGGQALSTTNRTVTVGGVNYFYTEKSLENLGAVSGNVTLTLKGDSKVGTIAKAETTLEDGTTVHVGELMPGTGNVFGGGESSYVTGAANKVTVNIEGNTHVLGNVFGGGDEGVVEGSTQVNIRPTSTP